MKCKFFLSVFLFVAPYFVLGQKVDKGNRDQDIYRRPSVSFTIAPSFFSIPELGINSTTFFLNNWHLNANFFILKKLSFTSGFNILFVNHPEEFNIHPEFGYSGPVRMDHRLIILNVPFRLNYYILNANTKLDPYFKVGFINSFKFLKTQNSPDLNGEYNYAKNSGYSNSMEFGLGLDYNVLKNLAMVFEAGKSYFISGIIPQYGLLEFQFGIRFRFLTTD